jgi:GH24 family phage-related lysozyme (muramidase)
MTYLEQSVALLKTPPFENCIPWLYRDTRGNVTVGVGKMIPSQAALLDLDLVHPFQCAAPPYAESPDGPGRATMPQMVADWNRLQALPYGQEYKAGSYKALSSVYLLDADSSALLMEVVTANDAELAPKLPCYAGLPDCVKVALLDMAYNLGCAGLLDGYPKMLAAAAIGDWITMAAQCRRGGIPEERNAWAAQEIKKALAPVIPQ